MKININKFKIAPKELYPDFTLCIYGEVDDIILSWAKEHDVLVQKNDKYTNFTLPDTFDFTKAFIQPSQFEWLDGFSPNLNKKLHIGHFSNLVLGKAFKSLGICKNTVSIYGDTLTGEISNKEGLLDLKKYQEKFYFHPQLEFMASEVKLEDEFMLADGIEEYAGTKIFNIKGEKIVGIKSNGQTTYFYQDVALASKLNASTLYLTGAEQEIHFKNLKELFPSIKHISLGLVKVSGKKMGTRFGNVILIDEFVDSVKDSFDNDYQLIYNVFAGFILKSNPEVDKKINMDIINNPKNSSGLYISYTMARLFSAGCEDLEYDSFKTKKLDFALLKSKINLKPNVLFDALDDYCKEINGLYLTNYIQGNEENKNMFNHKLSELIYGCKKLGLFTIKKV